MAKVIVSPPVFTGRKPYPKGKASEVKAVCYQRVGSSGRWSKVIFNQPFDVPYNRSVEIKCVVPYNDGENFAPFFITKAFKRDYEVVTPKLAASQPLRVILRDGDFPVRVCNFYKNGRAFTRDYTDYGEESAKSWLDTFGIPQPGGLTWKGFKDGDYLLAYSNEDSLTVVVSAFGSEYSNVLVDLIPKENMSNTVEAYISLPKGDEPFLSIRPVQSAQGDSQTIGKTYRCDWCMKDDVIYVAPKGDAFAAYIETGPSKQYVNANQTMTFECGDVKHIDPNSTMHAVGQVINRAMHKFILPDKDKEYEITITNKDGVSAKIKVVKELP